MTHENPRRAEVSNKIVYLGGIITLPFIMAVSSYTIYEDSTAEEYAGIFSLAIGDIVRFVGNYETIMRRIKEYLPEGLVFELTYIAPGTSLYIMYGPDHCIVTNKK